MANGTKGDHPVTDILHYREATFSPKADNLVREIAEYVSRDRLWDLVDWWNPPPIAEFESQLADLLGELKRDAEVRGWEPKGNPG